MKPGLKGHLVGMNRKTACGIPIHKNLLVFELSRGGYKYVDCKRCRKVVDRILGK